LGSNEVAPEVTRPGRRRRNEQAQEDLPMSNETKVLTQRKNLLWPEALRHRDLKI
jgi:hypothetical protein